MKPIKRPHCKQIDVSYMLKVSRDKTMRAALGEFKRAQNKFFDSLYLFTRHDMDFREMWKLKRLLLKRRGTKGQKFMRELNKSVLVAELSVLRRKISDIKDAFDDLGGYEDFEGDLTAECEALKEIGTIIGRVGPLTEKPALVNDY